MTPRRTNARYTRDVLERAIALHDRDGLTWPEIAGLLGYRQKSLESTVSRFRRGLWAPALNRPAELDAAMEQAIAERGLITTVQIGAAFGMKANTVHRRLVRRGLDRVMREDLAASSQDLRRAA